VQAQVLAGTGTQIGQVMPVSPFRSRRQASHETSLQKFHTVWVAHARRVR
jgi:hypothetical protein